MVRSNGIRCAVWQERHVCRGCVDHWCREGHAKARNTLHGLVFERSLPKDKTSLPRSRKALAGFAKDAPYDMRDPMPVEALALIVDWLIKSPLVLLRVLAAIALTCSFDMY